MGIAVTAEAAGSSPVVPAIPSQGVIGRDTENSNPQPITAGLIPMALRNSPCAARV